MTLTVHGVVPDDRVRELEEFVARHTTTERVVRDLEVHGLILADIHPMDEYTLDLVVPLPDGLTLVYDTT